MKWEKCNVTTWSFVRGDGKQVMTIIQTNIIDTYMVVFDNVLDGGVESKLMTASLIEVTYGFGWDQRKGFI